MGFVILTAPQISHATVTLLHGTSSQHVRKTKISNKLALEKYKLSQAIREVDVSNPVLLVKVLTQSLSFGETL